MEKKQRGEKVTSNDIEIAECLLPNNREYAKNDG